MHADIDYVCPIRCTSIVAPRVCDFEDTLWSNYILLLYHRFPATLLKPGLTGNPVAKGKQRFYAKWCNTTLRVGFFTIMFAASALAQDSEYIYWTEVGTSKIRRSYLDGTNPVDHITGVNNAPGIALQFASSSSSSSKDIRYVPFRSKYVVLVLFALLGSWYVLCSNRRSKR